MHAAISPVAISGCGAAHVKLPELIQANRNNGVSIGKEMRAGVLHYYLLLPQAGGLLLKNSGEFHQKRYALFKRRFSKNAFIDSFGGGIR
jgi:hypothetical protein